MFLTLSIPSYIIDEDLTNKYGEGRQQNMFTQYKKRNWKIFISIILALVLSFFFMMGNRIDFSGEIHSKYYDTTIRGLQFTDGVIFIALFVVLFGLFSFLVCVVTNKKVISKFIGKTRNFSKKEIVKWTILIALACWICWSPYFLAFYPGSVMGDSFKSIREIMGINAFTNHHPILYTLLIGFFVKLGNVFWNYNFGVFLYVLFQSTIMAMTVGRLIVWLHEHGIKKWFCVLSILFFAVLPVFPAYAMILWKDPLFSCAMLWYMMLLCDLVLTKGEKLKSTAYIIRFFVVMLLIMILRNNGIYIIFPTVFCLAIIYRKILKTKWLLIFAFVIGYSLVNGMVLNTLHIKTEFVESVGIPLQQMTRVVVEDGKMTKADKEFLFHLLPEDEYKKSYQPALVDSIKWNPEFDEEYLEEHKGEFFKTWLNMLKNNFSIYVDAYCLNTFGFWMPGVQTDYGYADRRIQEKNNVFNIHQVDVVERFFGVSLREKLQGNMVFIGSGTLAWIMLIISALLFMIKRNAFVPVLPILFNWGIYLVATPAAFGLRYVFILLFGLPLLIVLPFMFMKNEK